MGINIEYVIKCDDCKEVLKKPEDGFIIRGEIMVSMVDSKGVARGGLIGPFFVPELKKQDQVVANDVKVFCKNDIRAVVLCKECFMKALGLKEHQIPPHRTFGLDDDEPIIDDRDGR